MKYFLAILLGLLTGLFVALSGAQGQIITGTRAEIEAKLGKPKTTIQSSDLYKIGDMGVTVLFNSKGICQGIIYVQYGGERLTDDQKTTLDITSLPVKPNELHWEELPLDSLPKDEHASDAHIYLSRYKSTTIVVLSAFYTIGEIKGDARMYLTEEGTKIMESQKDEWLKRVQHPGTAI